METFKKRQKEMKRLERQRDKAARRVQRKQDRLNGGGVESPDAPLDGELLPLDGAPLPSDGAPLPDAEPENAPQAPSGVETAIEPTTHV
jgi:hypothetical protein